MKKPKPSQTQARLTTSPARPSLAVLRPQNRELFAVVAHRLAEALADVFDNEECPPFLRARIEEFHRAVVSEFNVEIGGDIRLRFGIAARLSQMGGRPE